MRNWRWGATVLAIAALGGAGALVGCGDDDDDGDEGATETTEAPVEEVTLVADDTPDYTFELSETPTLDTQRVVLDNQGEEAHALIFAKINEGFTVDEAFKLQGKKGSAEVFVEGDGAGPAQTKTIELTKPLEPGDYAMLCPIGSPQGPHYKLGQLEEFTIG